MENRRCVVNVKSIISPGDRFIIKGSEFEVAFVNGEKIRSAKTTGGQIFSLSVDNFIKLKESGQLKISRQSRKNEIAPSNLNDVEIAEMNRRLRYVRFIQTYAKFPRSRKYVCPLIKENANLEDDPNPPSFSTFVRWFKKFIESNCNPVSLVPYHSQKGNRKNRFDYEIEKLMQDRIKQDYLTEQSLNSKIVHENLVGQIVEEYADENQLPLGFTIPSYRTMQRRTAELDPYAKSKARDGKYIAKRSFKAAGKSIQSSRVLEKVQADGNILDVLIVDPDTGEVIGRPYGTCLIDHHTRCVLAFVITMIPFSATTILMAMKLAVSKSYTKFGGLFENLIVDNGSDYISSSLRNFCNHIGIQIEYGEPRNPNTKANVERFFGTFNKQFIHTIPGTTFENPQKKGDYDSSKYACITLDELNLKIIEWLDLFYHKNLHSGHGRVPESLWNECEKKTPIIHYELEEVEQIARDVITRTISGGRIRAFNLIWYSHALASIEYKMRMKNQKPEVHVYIDTLNLDRIFIRNPEDEKCFIQADSINPEYTTQLSLFEHKKVQETIVAKGKKDLAAYNQFDLAISRWKFRKELVNMGNKYASKQIARLKEIDRKRKIENPILKDLEESSSPPVSIQPEFNINDESINDIDDGDDEDYEPMEI